MDPNSGQIFNPDEVKELKEKAPQFAGALIELTGEEAERLSTMPRKDRRLELKRLRKQQKQLRKAMDELDG